jgi:hypothetical protein
MIKKIEGEKMILKKKNFAASKENTLGEEFFPLSEEILRREFYSSPRILFFTLTKEIFVESTRLSSCRRILLSVKSRFPVVI